MRTGERGVSVLTSLAGDLLFVDLTNREIRRQPCPPEVIRNFLGGRGLGDYLLLKLLDGAVGPLDPGNVLVFAAGLLGGSRMITTGRLHITARSPLTGLLGTSNGGGYFGAELKACGILALIITGRADKPVFINIRDQEVTIEDAAGLWGMMTREARARIRELTGDPLTRVAVIGPTGERLSPLGAIMTEDGHAAGRTGMGAVMGSKNLKAVAVRRSSSRKSTASPAAVAAVKAYLEQCRKHPSWEEWTTVGSSASVSWTDRMGASGARNYSQVTFPGVETACGSSFGDLVLKYHSCYNCPVHCRAIMRLDRGKYRGFVGERGEYEPLSSWGPRCGNADGQASVYLCNLCDEYGIDNLGTGNIVAFAIDLYERGILTPEDTGGLELTWGNTGAMEALLRQIAEGSSPLGEVLSKGMKRAAELIGRGAERYAYTVKGLSLTIMDPRGFKGSALAYAINSRGGDFSMVYPKPEYTYTPEEALEAYGTARVADRLSEEGKPLMVKECSTASAVIDSLGICKIPAFGILCDFKLTGAAGVLTAFLGETVTGEELHLIGERIVTAERLLNFRFGATGQDDTLPEKFLTEPIPEGPCKGSVVQLKPMLREFYHLMGWEEDGSVGRARAVELGLAELEGSGGRL